MYRSTHFTSPAPAALAGSSPGHGASRFLLIAAVSTALPTLLLVRAYASAGIALRELFGVAKRRQLVDRVDDARDSQEEAKEQFRESPARYDELIREMEEAIVEAGRFIAQMNTAGTMSMSPTAPTAAFCSTTKVEC